MFASNMWYDLGGNTSSMIGVLLDFDLYKARFDSSCVKPYNSLEI